ncbi:MAG: iron-sulfur cluster assembly scaffold protein [Candidatus Dadabacteria bacterium]|nr:iron-sulfur cluster assembly scaffold protein [Candidatus Dadabacteria bacterium]
MIHRELMDMLIDHYEHPRNFGSLEDADIVRGGGHPGCGDTITVYVKLGGGAVETFKFEGKGCMVSQAAASLLSLEVEGMALEDVSAMGRDRMVEMLGKEIVVRRPRCAMLALDTLKGALTAASRSAG